MTEQRHVIFQVGETLLGVPLESVREALELGDVVPVPKSKDYFRGVSNIRGQIVGVIDLRKLMRLEGKNPTGRRLLVFETPIGTLGAVVDKLVRVEVVDAQNVDTSSSVKVDGDAKFFRGFYRRQSEVIVLLDVPFLLSSQEYTDLRALVASAA